VATPARLRDVLPDATELALLFAARGLACLAAWHSGFRALSDDDYSRIAIAQHFAVAPSFDPSGTSWLPAPFWLYGAVFRLFGTELAVARATAIALALCATVLVYVAARLLGGGRFAALLGAVLSCWLVQYSVILGVAWVPELPCAGLLVFGVATLARTEPKLRLLGGLALLAASLSRYEAWPVAVVFAAYCAWDALRVRETPVVGALLLALAGPAAWLLVGRIEHQDALFFVARVTSYRRALGVAPVSLVRAVLEFPRLLMWDALGLWSVLLMLSVFSRQRPRLGAMSWGRAALALACLLLFLMWGTTRDGVPTHHAARVLLPLWFLACIATGQLIASFSSERFNVRIGVVLAFVGGQLFFSRGPAPGGECAPRSLELEAGRAARQFADAPLAIDTPDYGYFAVKAAFGPRPASYPLDDHDPRRPPLHPFASPAALQQALGQLGTPLVLLTTEHAALLDPGCAKLWQNTGFALFRCAPPAASR